MWLMARVLLGVTGGIAAYKAAELARLLVKAGHEVTPILTPEAESFVTAKTFEALARRAAPRELYPHLVDADLLVIEATFLERDAATARDYGHLTAAEAAALAATSNVRELMLTHISGRYADAEILTEATKVFPNSRVASDFDRIVI